MAHIEEDVDNGEDGPVEGDDADNEGEYEGGLFVVSSTPPGKEEAPGLLLKPVAEVKSMSQKNWWVRGQTVIPRDW